MHSWSQILLRSLREGSIQLWRNRFLSGTTIFLGALIIFLTNFIFSIQFFADYSLQRLESRADFTVPLRQDYDTFLMGAMQNELKAFDMTMSILPKEDFGDFHVPDRLYLKFKDLEQIDDIFAVLKKLRYDPVVDTWDMGNERSFVQLIEKLVMVREGVEKAGFYLSILFFVGGVLLIINAFRIVIFSRRDEIFIARFVGADPNFITFPFLVEGLLMGLAAALVGILLFIFVLREIEVMPGGEIFIYLWNECFTLEILLAAAVGLLGAYIATNRYMRGRFDQ